MDEIVIVVCKEDGRKSKRMGSRRGKGKLMVQGEQEGKRGNARQ